MEEDRRVADYFVIAGLPQEKDKLKLLDEYSLEVNLKPSAYQDPITDITVIFPSLGENVPDYFQLIDATPTGLSANLNHGSFRSPECFLCFRRGRDRPPLVDVGVLYDGKEKILPDSQIVEFTPGGHSANVNNATTSSTFLTYRRATDVSPCNELVVMDVCVIVGSKGEAPPHSFMKIDKTLNKGMVGSDVYICYKKSINRADLVSYKPSLQARFPPKDIPAYGLEDTVALFCLPMGATLECWPANSARSASVKSTFVLTLANRSKVYGSAITFYEEVDEEANPLNEEQEKGLQLHKYRRKQDRKILTNKCICVLSRWPFFEAFETFLFFLHKRQLMGPHDVPLERFVAHFLLDVPFPSPSRPRILLQLSPLERVALSQPEELPLPRCGASFRNLLMNLGPDNCLQVLLLALTEQKILLHSLRPAVLTSVAEAVMQIIFPFYWQCPYIPLCPIGMSDYLAAPLPFVIGLDSRFFDLYDQPTDVNAVDLDTNTVTFCEERRALSGAKHLPKRAARQLKQRLTQLAERCSQHAAYAHKMAAQMDDEAIDFDFTVKKKEQQLELQIREAFLQFMVSILSGYRHFLLPITSAPTVGATDADNLFDQAGFLRSRDRNFHKFYVMLMRTQMFTKFIEERSFVSDTNTCLAFFDECVDKLIAQQQYHQQHGGQPTEEQRFLLELDGFGDSDRTVFILPPEAADLPQDADYRTETFQLKEDLFPERTEPTDHDGVGAKENGGGGGTDDFQKPFPATPASALARRTKQEIRSAQKTAHRVQASPYYWARCLINTCYSLWFIHLPGYAQAAPIKVGEEATASGPQDRSRQTLRNGLTLLQRMKRLKLHPADEICYRVMMQLCGEHNQPTLAVKVLFEMRNIGLHPNAVTYGYYNKAVLESEWPSGEASATRAQTAWNRVRNVLLAMAIFRRVGREGNFRDSRMISVSTNAVDAASSSGSGVAVAAVEAEAKAKSAGAAAGMGAREEPDGVSQASSELSQDSGVATSHPQVLAPVTEQEAVIEDNEKTTKATKSEVEQEAGGDKGNGQEKQEQKEVDDKGLQFRQRLTSIVKPHGLADGEEETAEGSVNGAKDSTDGTSKATDGGAIVDDSSCLEATKRRLSFGGADEGEEESQANTSHPEEIKFQHQADDLGVSCLQDLKLDALGMDSKILQEAKSDASAHGKVETAAASVAKDELRDQRQMPAPPAVGAANATTPQGRVRYTDIRGKFSHLFNRSVDGAEASENKPAKRVNRTLFHSESADDAASAVKTDTVKLDDGLMKPPLPAELQKTPSSSSVRSASGGQLVGTPVALVENDPLGALTPDTSPTEQKENSGEAAAAGTLHKSATLPTGKPGDDILGSPFSDEKMSRSSSSTIPGNGADSSAAGVPPSTPTNSLSSISSGFKSLTKSSAAGGMSSRLSSLKKGSSYLSSYLSPNPATSKKTQEALSQGITSIKFAYSNAATLMGKRVEEIRESVQQPTTPGGLTPAGSYQYLSTPDGRKRDEDASSTCSGDSRRPSADPAFLYANDQSETWSSLTGALWDQFWSSAAGGGGTQAGARPSSYPKASEITEQFESLYAKLPKRLPGPEAMQVQMTSCSRCLYCQGILYDEEIMAGWTAEDSNLNTRCLFCQRMVVPFLTVRAVDFRARPMSKEKKVGSPPPPAEEEGEEDAEDDEVKQNGEDRPPLISEPITVPYLSPLVLRKELESMLEREGDLCLLEPSAVDSHPIIFWNLIWFFERIAVKSHLPGLCLKAGSLNPPERNEEACHPSWSGADHRNVYIKCRWDNERLHESRDPPLYTLWKQQSPDETEEFSGAREQVVVMTDRQNPAYKAVMQHVISGVQQNDLLQPIKTLLDRRQTFIESSEGSSSNPASPVSSPTKEKPSSSSSGQQQQQERTHRSVYREIVFLTLISLGQDNIDLTAFDREYRRAFDRLPAKQAALARPCDKPPSANSIFCRKLFRELKL